MTAMGVAMVLAATTALEGNIGSKGASEVQEIHILLRM